MYQTTLCNLKVVARSASTQKMITNSAVLLSATELLSFFPLFTADIFGVPVSHDSVTIPGTSGNFQARSFNNSIKLNSNNYFNFKCII